MKYMIQDNYGVHFTHNDADAVGCAICVDLFCCHELNCLNFNDDVKYPFMNMVHVTHNFNSLYAYSSDDGILSEYIRYLEYILMDNGDSLSEDDVTRYKELSMGNNYEHLNMLTVPKYIIISDVPITETYAYCLNQLSTKYGLEVLYVDHHKSNNMDGFYTWCHVKSIEDETNVSAAYLLRDILFEPVKKYTSFMSMNNIFDFALNTYINQVSRYDTWEWRYHPSKESDEYYTQAIIGQLGRNVHKAYEIIKTAIFGDEINGRVTTSLLENPICNMMISIYNDNLNNAIKVGLSRTVYTTGEELCYDSKYADTNIAMVILPDAYYNEIMEAIYNQKDKSIDIVIGFFTATKTLSFRRGTEKVDLSKFAEDTYGGGGHAAAAGAKLLSVSFINELSNYYKLLDDKMNQK